MPIRIHLAVGAHGGPGADLITMPVESHLQDVAADPERVPSPRIIFAGTAASWWPPTLFLAFPSGCFPSGTSGVWAGSGSEAGGATGTGTGGARGSEHWQTACSSGRRS